MSDRLIRLLAHQGSVIARGIIMKKSKATSKAASLLGRRSWKARLEKYGLEAMKEIFRQAGKKATGRPRMPDDQVKPTRLYQRARREKLRAEGSQL